MNVKALVLTGLTIGVGVVTFVALNLLAPITHADERHAPGVTAGEVFAASIAEPGAGAVAGEMEVAALDAPAPASAAPEAAPVSEPEAAGGSCAVDASAGAGAVVAGSEPATTEEPAAMEVAQAEPESFAAAEAPASEPAPEPAYEQPAAEPVIDAAPIDGEPTVAAGSCSTGAVDPTQKPVVVMASGVPGTSSEPPADAGSVGGPEMTASEPAAFESEPVAESPVAEPVVETMPEPESLVAEAPPPKPAAQSKPKAPVQKVPKVQPEETKQVWWPAQQSGKLNITYAGNVSFTKAIAIVTDGAHIDGAKANEHITVTTKAGKAVPGQWLVAKGNPQMLLYSVPPGVYKVTVGQGMSDRGNRSMPSEASGLVWVP